MNYLRSSLIAKLTRWVVIHILRSLVAISEWTTISLSYLEKDALVANIISLNLLLLLLVLLTCHLHSQSPG